MGLFDNGRRQLFHLTDDWVFYGGKLITSSLEKGQNYDKMKKSIVISIINSRLFSETEKMHSIFRLKEIDDGFVLSDRIEHHFLELGNLPQISSMEDLERLELAEARLSIARAMKAEGYPIEEICKLTICPKKKWKSYKFAVSVFRD